MGLFGSLFSSKSSSSSSSSVRDERVGADNNSNAVRSIGNADTITFGSDEVAGQAIDAIRESTSNALTSTADVLQNVFDGFLTATDRSLERSNENLKANQTLSADLLRQEQESSDDRLIKVIGFALLSGVSIVAIRSGFLKGVFK